MMIMKFWDIEPSMSHNSTPFHFRLRKYIIRSNDLYDVLLTSWTPPLTDKSEISRLIDEGEAYIQQINRAVKACYQSGEDAFPSSCACAVQKLGLPPFMLNPVVDRAFRSHFRRLNH